MLVTYPDARTNKDFRGLMADNTQLGRFNATVQAPEGARGPDNSHVGPMICVWAAPPTRISRG